MRVFNMKAALPLAVLVLGSMVAGRAPPADIFAVTFDFDSKHEVEAAGLISLSTGDFHDTINTHDADFAMQGSGMVRPGVVAVSFVGAVSAPYIGLFNVSAASIAGGFTLPLDGVLEIRCMLRFCYGVYIGDDASETHFIRIDTESGKTERFGTANLTMYTGLTLDSSTLDETNHRYFVVLLNDDLAPCIVTLNLTNGDVVKRVQLSHGSSLSGPLCFDDVVGLVSLGANLNNSLITKVDWRTGHMSALRNTSNPLGGLPAGFGTTCSNGFLSSVLIDYEKNLVVTVDLRQPGAPTVASRFIKYTMHAVSHYP